MSKQTLWSRWTIALFMALGLGVIWGFLVLVGGSIFSTLSSVTAITQETITVTVDGVPLINARLGGNYLHTETRTLDGTEVEQDKLQFLNESNLGAPYVPPGVVEVPVSWPERIAGATDFKNPPGGWVMIRDAEQHGHVYWAGFDSLSKLPIGYLSREGFSQAKPPREHWFDIGPQRLVWTSHIAASSGYLQMGRRAYLEVASEPTDEQTLARWVVYLIDSGRDIYAIDLRDRAVRKVITLDGLSSIAVSSIPLPRVANDQGIDIQMDEGSDDEADVIFMPAVSRQDHMPRITLAQQSLGFSFVQVAPNASQKRRKLAHRLLCRCVDRLVLINPFNLNQQVFPLSAGLAQADFSAWTLSDDRVLLQVRRGFWEHGSVVDLVGIDSTGAISEPNTLRLSSHAPGDPRVGSLGLAAIGPSPIAWLSGMLAAVPGFKLQAHQAESYSEAVRSTVSEGWPGALLVLVAALVSTWFVWQKQIKNHRPNTRLWCTTTLILGVPGLLAYWALHRVSPLEACPKCGELVPRNQHNCAQCQEPFPEPALLGTEVLV